MRYRFRTHSTDAFIQFILVFIFLTSVASCSRQPLYPAPPQSDGNISIDVAKLPLEVPQFYTYRSGDTKVNFFVIRMHDKTLSFLDACVTCYPKKRGYEDRSGYVVCRACDMSFSIYRLERGIGGCYPIKVEGTMKDRMYVIPVMALEKMADKF